MAQIFPKAVNPVARMLVLGLPMLFGATGVGLAAFYRSSYATGVEEVVPQPVAFSHAHHVGQLGIHCLYCHTSVEESHFANVPPTKTCINCHQEIWTGADLLAPVRESYKAGTAIAWNRVHNVPHYAYFNHAIHVGKGVGCFSCHGQMDEMNLTWQAKTLLMEWCINCHRNPEEQLRPLSEVYDLRWQPGRTADGRPQVWKREDLPNYGKLPDGSDMKEVAELVGKPRPATQLELGKKLKELYHVRDAVTLIGCSNCHR
jgi:hypothetical protein